MSEHEEWRPLMGYEGLYEVSSLGRLQSLSRVVKSRGGTRTWRGRVLSVWGTTDGYLRGSVSRESVRAIFLMHRAVALAFCPGARPWLQVNHKDGDKTNNCASNLEWVTGSQNMRHAVQTGLINFETRSDLRVGGQRAKEIRTLLKQGHSQAWIARHMDLSKCLVSNVALGKSWLPLAAV